MSKAPVRRPGTLLRNRPPIAVFRGSGCIEALLGYRRAVLRPEMYSRDELTELEQGGTLPLASPHFFIPGAVKTLSDTGVSLPT